MYTTASDAAADSCIIRYFDPNLLSNVEDGMQPLPALSHSPAHVRLRFVGFTFSRSASGQCSAQVTLEAGGKEYVGSAIGSSTQQGEMRASAEACLRALEQYSVEGARMEVLGVKQVRAFDSNLAIVSVCHHEARGAIRLVGCYLAGDDVNRGTAIAVLNATNRVFAYGSV